MQYFAFPNQSQKAFVDFIQDEFIPQLERLENYGVGNPDDSSVCDSLSTLIKDGLKMLSGKLNPCNEVKQKRKKLAYLVRLDDTLKSMEKMPVVKKPAKLIRSALVKPLASVQTSLEKLEKKCDEFNSKLRTYLAKALDTIPKVAKLLKIIRLRLIYDLTLQCAIRGSISGRRTRSLRMIRLLEDELSKQTGKDHSNRRLGFDASQIFDEGIRAALPQISSVECVLSAFGTGTDLITSELGSLFEPIALFLSAFQVLELPDNSPFGDMIDGFASIVDKLSFLQCPREKLGIFGFLCDLDAIIFTLIEEILKAIGIDIEAIIETIVSPFFEAFGIPDANLIDGFFPDLTLFSTDLEAQLLLPIQESIREVFQDIVGDPMESAFSVTGVSDLNIQGIELEFRYASGTATSLSVSCADLTDSYPLSVSAFVNKACGASDLTGALEFPCGEGSECTISDQRLSSQACGSGFQDEPDFGFSSTMFDKTSIIYTCVTKAQVDDHSSAPDASNRANKPPVFRPMRARPNGVSIQS